MTRMTTKAENAREKHENRLMSLCRAKFLLSKQVILRIKQAIGREASMGPLLSPALVYTTEAVVEIEKTTDYLAEVWRDHEAEGWLDGQGFDDPGDE